MKYFMKMLTLREMNVVYEVFREPFGFAALSIHKLGF